VKFLSVDSLYGVFIIRCSSARLYHYVKLEEEENEEYLFPQ